MKSLGLWQGITDNNNSNSYTNHSCHAHYFVTLEVIWDTHRLLELKELQRHLIQLPCFTDEILRSTASCGQGRVGTQNSFFPQITFHETVTICTSPGYFSEEKKQRLEV